MKGKKGQEGMFFFSLLLVGLIAWWISSVAQSTNPYNTCVSDCRKINGDAYSYQDMCSNIWNSSQTFECTKIDYDRLNELCWQECKPHDSAEYSSDSSISDKSSTLNQT
ncbi:MAG: hypothetical protein ACFFG0_20015 [Candidatus Thorarchaeota archaeon]